MTFFKNHKVVTGILLVLVLLIVLCGVFIFDKLNRISYHDGTSSETSVQDASSDDDLVIRGENGEELEDMDAVLSDLEIFKDSDVFNILLLGTDDHTKEFSDNARADSIMILSIHKKDKNVKLVSLQRGIGVPILEGEYEGSYDWLTHCFRYGGADLMLKEVQYCFRVDVDRYVRVNFNTFAQIVDSVGGVDITLTQQEVYGLSKEAKHPVTEGLNHLDGYDALQYARLRQIDSDWRRIERQRNVIQAVIHQSKGLSLLELNELANTILPLIQTNLTKTEILELITYAPLVLGTDIEQRSLPVSGTYGSMTGLEGRSLYAVDFDVNAKVLHWFLYGETAEEGEEEVAA